MKRKHLFLLLGLFFAIVFTSVTYAVQMQPRMVATTQGDETIEQRLDDPLFTLEVAFPLDLRVVASDRDYLTIQGPKKLLRKVVVTTKGLELRIRGHKSFWGNKFRGRLTGTLYTSDPNMLSELRLSSASKVISETIMRVTMFDLDMSGASTFVGEVHCNNADVKLNGASHARIKGNSGVLKVNQSGASKFVIEGECSELLLGIWGASLFDGKQLMAYRADMEVGGASKAYVAAQSPGKVNVMGSAHLEMPLVSRQGEGAEEVKIKVIGSSSFVGSCFAHHADIEVSGSSSLKLNGIFGKADVEVSGASKVSLSGRCDRFEAEVSGSSKLDAERFISRAVDIDVSSSAKAVVHATESLNADVSSSGKLDYIGNPRHRSLEQSGGGKVGRK